MISSEVAEVIGDHSGLSRTVLEYSVIMKRLVDRAKQPVFYESVRKPQ